MADLIISSPRDKLRTELAALKEIYESPIIYLKNFILDEADTLLDDSFNQTTLKCLNRLDLNLALKKFPNESHKATSDDIKVLDQPEDVVLEPNSGKNREFIWE